MLIRPPELLRRNRNYRLYFTARSITALTLAIGPTAVPFAVLRVDKSAGAVASVVTATNIPVILFVLVGGVLGDRYQRMFMLAVANVVSALAQIAMAVTLVTHSATLGSFLLLAVVSGLANAVALPAGGGFVVQIVETGQVASAQALLTISRTSLMVVGAAVGGGLVGLAGPAVTIAVNGVLYLVSIVPLLRITVARSRRVVYTSLAKALREGWTEFRSRGWLVGTLAQNLVYVVCMVAAYQIIAPVIAPKQLGGPAGLGLLLAARALGGLGGALLAARAGPRSPLRVGQISLLMQIAVLTTLGMSAPYPLLFAVIALDGAAAEYFQVIMLTAVQLRIDMSVLSRITSYTTLVDYGGIPLSGAAMIPLAHYFPISEVLFLLAGFSGCATVLTLLLTRRHARRAGPAGRDSPTAVVAGARTGTNMLMDGGDDG
ncbi:MFS transporter [Catenulispora sp. NL8]|uniref:MFS transporter n=1 Tax=Catenulispora pinistramenti TaxID=2705254 RepID=A0ABS5KRC4_9ACTN|nr:MFS transporter [Catenulispora pinistramenti]MBS2548579.1 MFS transporter [Catenulispora pinistramenti]